MVDRVASGKIFTYEIVPLFDALDNPIEYNISDSDTLFRAINSEKQTQVTIDETKNNILKAALME